MAVYYEYRYRYRRGDVAQCGGMAYAFLKDCIADAKRRLAWDKKILGGIIEIWSFDMKDLRDEDRLSKFVRYVTRQD